MCCWTIRTGWPGTIPAALAEEWELILANSRPGTRILLRSAGLDLSFVPANVRPG